MPEPGFARVDPLRGRVSGLLQERESETIDPERLGSPPARSWLILSDSFPEVLAKLGPAGGRPGRSPAQAACARSNSIGER